MINLWVFQKQKGKKHMERLSFITHLSVCGLWTNIAKVFSLCNVDQVIPSHHFMVIFPRKDEYVLWTHIAQVVFLDNVVSRHIKTTLVRRYSYAMLRASQTTFHTELLSMQWY